MITVKQLNEWHALTDAQLEVVFQNISLADFNTGERVEGEQYASEYHCLYFAVKNNDARLVKLLLAIKVCENYIFDEQDYERSLFKVAVDNNHYENFKFLFDGLKHKAGNKFLHYAIRNGKDRLIDFLLRVGIDINIVNNAGANALHYAMAYKKDHLVSDLLKRGINTDVVIKTHRPVNGCVFAPGDTMFHCAAICNNEMVAKSELTRDPELITQIDRAGNTLLMSAIQKQRKDLATFLVEKTSIDLNAMNTSGETAIYLAITNRDEKMALRLLELKVVVGNNHQCRSIGTTELHLALHYGYSQVVREIIKQRPSLVNVKNLLGETPLDVARKTKNSLLPLMELISYQQRNNCRARDNYKLSSFCGFFRIFGINYSAGQKQDAAQKLVDVVLNGADKRCLQQYKGALNNGELKRIANKLKLK